MRRSSLHQRTASSYAPDSSAVKDYEQEQPSTSREKLKELEKINVNPHFEPQTFGDHVARNMVRGIKSTMVEMPFKHRLFHQALIMETLGVVPGFVAYGFHRFLSIFSNKQCKWKTAAIDEGLRERWHLKTWMDVVYPRNIFGRMFARSQVVMWVMLFTPFYVLFPRVAHRFIGYLEEMAVNKYTELLHAIDSGQLENVPAPQVAKDYWKLPVDATIRDVILIIRADEADHREINHHISNLFLDNRTHAMVPCNEFYMDLKPIQAAEPHLPDHAISRVKLYGDEDSNRAERDQDIGLTRGGTRNVGHVATNTPVHTRTQSGLNTSSWKPEQNAMQHSFQSSSSSASQLQSDKQQQQQQQQQQKPSPYLKTDDQRGLGEPLPSSNKNPIKTLI